MARAARAAAMGADELFPLSSMQNACARCRHGALHPVADDRNVRQQRPPADLSDAFRQWVAEDRR